MLIALKSAICSGNMKSVRQGLQSKESILEFLVNGKNM